MNIQEYIESGILELYAAGALNMEEQMDVERMVAMYPEIASELNEVELVAEELIMAAAIAPSISLKDKILNAAGIPDAVNTLKETPVFQLQADYRPYKIAIAASISLLIVSLFGIGVLWSHLDSTKLELAALTQQNKTITKQFFAVQASYKKESKYLEVLRDPGFIKLKLKGSEKAPQAYAVVYWNSDQKMVMMDPINLPLTDENHQYQLWALVDGKPIDAGIFDINTSDSNLLEMKSISQAQAFAVTLEPTGGSVNPTLEQLVLFAQI